MIQIGFAITNFSAVVAENGPAPDTAVVTLDAFSRDRTIFDSNAANGGNAADVPASGTTDAADGAQIEARVVHHSSGAQVHPWTTIATASGGAWSGTYPAAERNTQWLRLEARVQGSAATATTSNRFGVGIVLAMQDQSNTNRGVNGTDAIASDTITIGQSDAKLQVVWSNGGAPVGPLAVDDTTTVSDNTSAVITASTARMAAAFNAVAPGIPVMIGFITKSGSGLEQILRDDPGTDRDWSTDVTNPQGTGVADILKADGSEVGILHMTHNVGRVGTNGIIAATLGTDDSGNVIAGVDRDAAFADAQLPGLNAVSNHVFAEVFPGLKDGRTRWLTSGGSGVEADGTGSLDTITDRETAADRLGELSAYLGARVVPYLPRTAGLLKSNDRVHFSQSDLRGMPERFAGLGAQFAWAAGLATPVDALFDQITWAPDKVTLGSSAGDVTTKAVADNGGSLDPADYFPDDPTGAPGTAGFSEVLGFFDETFTPLQAAIVNGAVEVYPATGFDGLSKIYYLSADDNTDEDVAGRWPGPGGGTAADYDLAQWSDHLPVILHPDWGWSVYGGRLVPPPEDSEFINAANGLSTGDPVVTISAGQPSFESTADYGALASSRDALTVEMRAKRNASGGLYFVAFGPSGADQFWQVSGRRMLINGNGDMLIEMQEAGTNDTLIDKTIPAATLGASDDDLHTWRLAMDFVAGDLSVSRDGVEVYASAGGADFTATSTNGIVGGERYLMHYGGSNGDVAWHRVWDDYTPTGDPGAPLLDMTAQAAAPGYVLTNLDAI